MKHIKYFAYYDESATDTNRNIVLSAVNKIDYIIHSLNRIGYSVDIVSFAGLNGTGFSTSPSEKRQLGLNTLQLFRAFSGPKVLQPIFRSYMALSFILWIIFNCKQGEEIIIYHSLGYTSIFNFLQKFKQFKIIGEVEEIYQDVQNDFSAKKKKEEYVFFENCSKFIFPSCLIEKKINIKNRPYIIVHGVYNIENTRTHKALDDKHHVVYAGTFDHNKGGAQAAILATQYLPKGYHVHLIGFGTEKDTQDIKNMITQISTFIDSTLTYDGLVRGTEFNQFLQKCCVGLSTQNPEDAFNDTSFPSKVLTYMSNGLAVVSYRINVLTTSSLDPYIYYAKENTPKAIAEAIIHAVESPNSLSSLMILQQLNENFLSDLSNLLY